ncbi:MAG: PRC-barrel domain-containing protein [Verrucomicrobiae bacterium]
MKIKSPLIAAFIVASCCCLQAREEPNVHELQYRAPATFLEFIGAQVRNPQDEKLGKVEAITVDLHNGRLVEVIVRTGGGFLGLGSKTTAVPSRALTPDYNNRVLRLDVSKAKFQAAPKFDMSDLQASSKPERVAKAIRYFGWEPWFYLPGQVVRKDAEILEMGYVQRTNRIIGLQIMSENGEYVGRVGSLLMDLRKGRVTHVVVVTNASASPRSVIQARALRFNAAKDGLVLDATPVELAGTPKFQWLNAGRTSLQQENYVNREVKADKGLHSKQNAQEGIVRSSVAMDQGENFRDEQKTARIKRAIQADHSLSMNAKNIEVVTINAQTTLRGRVNSAAGKQRIGEIALQAGRPENVSNLLEVRPE